MRGGDELERSGTDARYCNAYLLRCGECGDVLTIFFCKGKWCIAQRQGFARFEAVTVGNVDSLSSDLVE